MIIKTVLATIGLFQACIQSGESYQYHMDRDRTSRIVRDAKLDLSIDSFEKGQLSYSAKGFVKPIFGQQASLDLHDTYDLSFITPSWWDTFKTGDTVYDGGKFKAKITGHDHDCDIVTVYDIPNTDELTDLSVKIEVCVTDSSIAIPQFDVSARKSGMRIAIGFDTRDFY